MSGSSDKSPIDKLDSPCLVRILQRISPQQQRVGCAAVCSKWRTATREAINSIEIVGCSQQKCDQLQQWAVHPPAALLTLALHGMVYGQRFSLRLQLSVLQHLRELKLSGVLLEALAADGSVLKVADLLPQLQHCTKLTLSAWGQPELTAAAAAYQAMPALQDLDTECENNGLPAMLVVLPTTLTRLCLYNEEVITTTSAESISQLTGLRVLEVSAHGFDTSVLAKFAGLDRIEIDIRDGDCSFSGENGFAAPLLVFGSMPKLKHLHLQSSVDETPVATSAELAALSASSNLTYLSLGHCEYCALPPAAYDSWFPPGRQCPYLQHVDVGMSVLGNTAAVQRMVSACPGLKELELHCPNRTEMPLESASVVASLQALTNLTSLTRLRLEGRALPEGSCISPAVVNAWSHWTSLQQLEFPSSLKCSKMEDVLVLTQLRTLRTLDIFGYIGGQYYKLYIEAQATGPPDVWCQLPAVVWGAAIRRKEEQLQQRLQDQQAEQVKATALLKRLNAAQAQAASLSEQHAAAQEKIAALQEQQAADQADLAALLQKQQQAEAAMLRDRLQEQQAKAEALCERLQEQQAETAVLHERLQEQQQELAATRQQAEVDRAQTALLQSQVSTLQATVAALLERQG